MSMTVRMLALAIVLASSSLASAQAQAPAAKGPADGPATKMPKSAACIVTKAVTCKDDATCTPTMEIGEAKLPLKITIDFENRVLMSVDKDGFPVASPISSFVGGNKQIILQGVDEGIGWIIHGSESDLTMSFSIASHHTVLSGFGTCEIDDDK
jgi:hypothetical protein